MKIFRYFLVLLLSCGSFAELHAESTDTSHINLLINKAARFLPTIPDSAILYFEQAVSLCRKGNHQPELIHALDGAGRAYFSINNHAKATQCWYEALNLCKTTGLNKKQEIYFYLMLADSYNEGSGIKDSASWCYYMAEQKINGIQPDDPELETLLYTRLAFFWLQAGTHPIKEDLVIASGYIKKVRSAAARLSDSSRSEVYFLEGYYYFVHTPARLDSSLFCYLKYLEPGDAILVHNRIRAYLNISEIYIEKGMLKNAREYLDKVARLDKYLFPTTRIYYKIEQAKYLYHQKDYPATVKLLDSIINANKQFPLLNNTILEAYSIAANSLDSLGQYKRSIVYKNEYLLLSDSLLNMDRMQSASRLEIRSRIAEKDRSIAQQQLAIVQNENNLKSKNILILGISSLLIFLTLISLLVYRNSRSKIRHQQKQMEINQLQDTIKGEENERKRLALELHDGLGGLLASARMNFSMARNDHSANGYSNHFNDGMEMLSEASSELRKTAHNLTPDSLLNTSLPEALQLFCSRIHNSYSIAVDFNDYSGNVVLHPQASLSIYRIIQELVYNSVKHGKPSRIMVQLSCLDDLFSVMVEDNGSGMTTANGENGKAGIGLANINDRLKTLNGHIEFTSDPGEGTSVYLEFDLPFISTFTGK